MNQLGSKSLARRSVQNTHLEAGGNMHEVKYKYLGYCSLESIP